MRWSSTPSSTAELPRVANNRPVAGARLEVRDGLQWALSLVEEKGQVEQSASEVWLEGHGLLEPSFGGVAVSVVHGEHAEVEVNAVVVGAGQV